MKKSTLNSSQNFFIPILKKGTLLIGAKSAYISGQSIFSNELFRIGGLQSFRGFDDESIFASFLLNNLDRNLNFGKIIFTLKIIPKQKTFF